MPKIQKKAFSLIELSVTLLIISLIIGGTLQAKHIIWKFRVATAQSLTKNSAVAKIDNLILWLESTLDTSFIAIEAQDNNVAANDGISIWYDLQQSSNSGHNATSSSTTNNPKYYANCINGLPCARFNGTTNKLDVDIGALAGNDYTIFLVEQRRSNNIGIIIGRNSSPSSNTSIEIGYNSLGEGLFAQGSSADYYKFGTSPAIGTYSSPIARLHTFTNPYQKNGVTISYHHLNGLQSTLSASGSPSFTNLTAFSSANIGSGYFNGAEQHFNGDIGELIIYNRALSAEEQKSIEDYLLKKWHI